MCHFRGRKKNKDMKIMQKILSIFYFSVFIFILTESTDGTRSFQGISRNCMEKGFSIWTSAELLVTPASCD